MGRPHKFDHDEAKRLRAEGMTIKQIAERMGVSLTAVSYVVIPGAKAKAAEYSRERVRRLYGLDDDYTEKERKRSREYQARKRAEQSA